MSWYINSYDGSVRYEDFVDEFIPYVDEIYRTRSEKQFCAIAGLSMGGYGARPGILYSRYRKKQEMPRN